MYRPRRRGSGEVDHERGLHSAVEALAEREHDHGRDEEQRRGARCLAAGERHDQPGCRPQRAEQPEDGHPPPPLREAGRGQLREDDDDRVDEEHDPDLRLRHARLVLRVHGQELEAGEAREDEQGVQADHGHEGPLANDVAVRTGPPARVRAAAERR